MVAQRDPPEARTVQTGDLASTPALPAPVHTMLLRAAHAMIVASPDGGIIDANPRAEALLDKGPAELRGIHLESILAEKDRAEVLASLRLAAKGAPAPVDMEATLCAASGGRGLISITFLPFDGPRVALLLRDLTEERAARTAATVVERDAYRAATEEHGKMAELGRLISGVAHELRTPLTYITNTLRVERTRLEEMSRTQPALTPLLAEVLEHHRAIEGGIARINRLVRDMRPLTKNKPFMSSPVDLAELVMDAVKTFRGARSDAPRLELDLQATHQVPLDRDDMHNVVLNLLNNAADASPPGATIRIQTRNMDAPPEIRISDRGAGVSAEMLPHLFEPFRTTKREGTGLGLFISKCTVQAHGGTLTHEPTPGGGATFVVRLPMDHAA